MLMILSFIQTLDVQLILEMLLLIQFLLAIIQPTDERRVAAWILIGFNTLHHELLYELKHPIYFLSAAIFDLMIAKWLSSIARPPILVIHLQTICLASVLLNFMGFILYTAGLPRDNYKLAFIPLNILTILMLFPYDYFRDCRRLPEIFASFTASFFISLYNKTGNWMFKAYNLKSSILCKKNKGLQ
ncbi:MAG: hypothetical protein V3U78_04570 [Thiotrichaceae bacterium]